MIENLNPIFVRIPNVIMYDKKIVPNAKYLYGIIDMLSYYTDSITNDDLCNISQLSHNSIEKYLKLLRDNHYIAIYRKKNSRKLTPLVPHSLELQTHKQKEIENQNNLAKLKQAEENKILESMTDKEKELYLKRKELIQDFVSRMI